MLWSQDAGEQWGEGIWDSDDHVMSAHEYARVPASQYKCNAYVAKTLYRSLGLVSRSTPKLRLPAHTPTRARTSPRNGSHIGPRNGVTPNRRSPSSPSSPPRGSVTCGPTAATSAFPRRLRRQDPLHQRARRRRRRVRPQQGAARARDPDQVLHSGISAVTHRERRRDVAISARFRGRPGRAGAAAHLKAAACWTRTRGLRAEHDRRGTGQRRERRRGTYSGHSKCTATSQPSTGA